MKKLLAAIFILGAFALPLRKAYADPIKYIQSSTSTQVGTVIHQSSGTIDQFTAISATFTNTISLNNKKILNVSSGTIASDGVRYSQNKVIQVVLAETLTSSATTVATFVPSNLTVTITPTSTSSRIYVHACFQGTSSNVAFAAVWTIFRGTSNNLGGSAGQTQFGSAGTISGSLNFPVCFDASDTPASTSAQTYTVYMKNLSGGITVTTGASNVGQFITATEVNGL